MNSQGLIVAAVVTTAATTFVAQSAKGHLYFRSYLAAGFLGVFLSAIALVNEQLASNFAILVLVVALLRNGTQTLAFLGNKGQ